MSTRTAYRRLTISLLLGLTLMAALPAQTEARARERSVLAALARVLPSGHLSRHPLDDEISRRALTGLVDKLDPQKIYFMKADLDALAKKRDQLDDLVREGDGSFAMTVAQLLLERLAERVTWTRELLKAGLDFDRDEFFINDGDGIDFAATTAAARDRWRQRLKYEILLLEGPDLTRAQAIEKLTGRQDRYLARMKAMAEVEWFSMFVNAITTAYDPHSAWLAPRDLKEFEIAMRLNFQGVGARLQDEDGFITITSLMPGGSAIKDGLLAPRDRILAVAQGDDGPFTDVVGLPISDVVDLVRGPEGTVVRLQVRPKDGGEIRIHRLVRQKLQLEDSAAHGKVFELGEEGKQKTRIGVIDLPEFYRDDEAAQAGQKDYRSASRDVARILGEFKTEAVDAVVLDLRLNGGGSLKEAIELTGLFIDQGPVVQVRNSRDRLRTLSDTNRGMTWEGPLVVLTSRFSASASEILAGAIQDYRRGLIVGDPKTHGKGSVQTVMPLDEKANDDELGALKVTIQQFYRPDGASTQLRGVIPDLILPSWSSEIESGEDELPQALPFHEVEAANFVADDDVQEAAIPRLRELSRERIESAPYFQRLESSQAWFREQKKAGRIPLQQKAFAAWRAEERSRDLRPDDETADEDRIVRDGYLDEVMNIGLDLLRLCPAETGSKGLARKAEAPAAR